MEEDKPLTKKEQQLFKKANIEIISFCRECGEVWCSIEENILINKCEKCGSLLMENVCRYDDVLNFLRGK